MTIRNMKAFLENLWDWGILDGCFGRTKISPTDIDGFVERKGKFLVIETKSPNTRIPNGQMRTLTALQRTGLFTLLVVWGKKDNPEHVQVFTRNEIGMKKPCDLKKLREIVSAWYSYANNAT